ncbi:T9SS type B sorting domain-containing protein [uncultured Maribacter sp.]|uniref:T9SS type B sorting domain-containing protein n=1 Tax=uncultured Maribacter sp. TaxID=431308 RepID=UPI002614DDBE|nr:T9SS type B sorting domain-containing protein [uncultured Maribacter sp.]
MKTYTTFSLLLFLFFCLISTQILFGQLGFCGGNSGDPIFTETFGTGTDRGPALPTGITSYFYTTGVPADGDYTISSNTNFYDWHNTTDHTPGDTNGKSFIVNAHFTAGEFYRRTVSGLCENTSYEFSSWLINLQSPNGFCENGGLPINVRFQIWDSTDTTLLASGDTGNIMSQANPVWEQYGLVFKTEVGQTSVILKMINNGNGGCGNDLAIDDIVFKSCGDFITVRNNTNENSISSCADQGPISTTLTATPDFSIFNTHAYQWQESVDQIIWTDILGETNPNFTTPLVNTTTHYRVKVSEDPINISNDQCNVLSETFSVYIIPIPEEPINNGDNNNCQGEISGLSVTVPEGVLVNWYDAASGGNLLESNTSLIQVTTAGTYYAEAVSEIGGCISTSRVGVTANYYPTPIVVDENLIFCEGEYITFSADIPNETYLWSTGETTFSISTNTPGTYTVEVTDTNGCSATKTIILEQIDAPILKSITSDGPSIIIKTKNTGEFEYALNFGIFQTNPVFEAVSGGQYFITIRERNFCGEIYVPYFHLVIPKFFTPNNDGFHDNFIPEGIPPGVSYSLSIYDRYGKLLFNSLDNQLGWDGTFNNSKLPAADYWYSITIENFIRKGHFSLKR